jgi:hypothetical protein
MGKVSRRIPGKDTLGQLRKEASTTASSFAALNRMPIVRMTTPRGDSPEGAPEKPRVDLGPKAYKEHKSHKRSVIRFFVQLRRGRWFVLDVCSRGRYAAKTSENGYATKQEAVAIAREYRDRYGAYAKVPF